MFNEYELPVYTVMDKIQEYNNDAIECGMYFLETKNHMPLRGNGWYMHNTVIECLNNGIITKSNIKYQIIPSMKLQPEYFKQYLESVLNNFSPKMSKIGPNAFIGCMNKKKTQRVKMNMTTSPSIAMNEYILNQMIVLSNMMKILKCG